MIVFNRTLVYTHKFDKWQYIVVNNYDTKKYSILDGLSNDEESILHCINNNQFEMAYYFLNDCYYQVISTPRDLLKHIEYSQKDNRKHELNRGFHEYKFSISDTDTIPLALFEFAIKIYMENKHGCEIDLSQVDFTQNDENISKFLYVANSLMGLNVYYKIYSSETLNSMPSKNDSITISIGDIKDLISNEGIYPTYLNIFVYNLGANIKVDIVNEAENVNTLKWILNSTPNVIENQRGNIRKFLSYSGLSIDINNVWNLIDDYSIKNQYALDTILNLNITLNDIVSSMINTSNIQSSLYEKYLNTVVDTTTTSLENFLNDTKNQDRLDKVYNKISNLNFKQPCLDFENFKNNVINIELSPNSDTTMMKLLKSMCLDDDLIIDIINSILKNQYLTLLSEKDILSPLGLNILKNIITIVQFEYSSNQINSKLRTSSKIFYDSIFKELMNINPISIEENKKIFQKAIFNLDGETFKSINRFAVLLFKIYNPKFNFENISGQEKILILTTPELLLKFINFCDTNSHEDLVSSLFMEDEKMLNIGMVQVEYIKYILYQLLDDTKILTELLNSLNLAISLKDCKWYLEKLKKSLKDMLNIHKFIV